MALLNQTALSDICDKAIDWGLATDRDALFVGIPDDVVASVRVANGRADIGLRREADALNRIEERTADGFALAMWLRNCENGLAPQPGRAEFFGKWATTVDALRPANDWLPAAGEILVAGRAEAAGDADLQLAIRAMEGYTDAAYRRATALMISKRLHDSLHGIQINVLPLWRRGIDGMAKAPATWRLIVQTQQRQLRTEADRMAGDYTNILQPDDPLRRMGQKTVDALLAAAGLADEAIATNDLAGLGEALRNVRDTVKDDMGSYATKMETSHQALELGVLIENLKRLADNSANAQLVANARGSAEALEAIMHELDVVGPQHSDWQKLDTELWMLEEHFGLIQERAGFPGPMGVAEFATFNYEWKKVLGQIAALAGTPPAEWDPKVSALRDALLAVCPMPMTEMPGADEAADVAQKFEDFVLGVRGIFQTIDRRMKDACNLLREITTQLARL